MIEPSKNFSVIYDYCILKLLLMYILFIDELLNFLTHEHIVYHNITYLFVKHWIVESIIVQHNSIIRHTFKPKDSQINNLLPNNQLLK